MRKGRFSFVFSDGSQILLLHCFYCVTQHIILSDFKGVISKYSLSLNMVSHLEWGCRLTRASAIIPQLLVISMEFLLENVNEIDQWFNGKADVYNLYCSTFSLYCKYCQTDSTPTVW